MSLSLPLSKEFQRQSTEKGSPKQKVQLSVERCLQHFTVPETLADPVDCPSCRKKTPTKKQHVVSKLPKVLCLHLKRFDAAQNKKIEEFVSFPGRGLNMGPYLPHW
jgi:ubiquitin C-terminal hydrolase